MSAESVKVGEQQSIDLKDCILLGKLVGIWGVKGWLKVFSYTRPRNNIGQYKRWLLVSPTPDSKKSSNKLNSSTKNNEATSRLVSAASVSIKNCKEQGQNVIAQIEGIDYRDQAEGMFGLEVYIEKTQLKPLKEGEFYWSEMIGCEVINLQGVTLGKVSSMMETGANDVLVVHQQSDQQSTQSESSDDDIIEHLIPYSDQIVTSVNVDDATITVDWGADFLVTEKNTAPRKKKITKQERSEEIRLVKLASSNKKSANNDNDESKK